MHSRAGWLHALSNAHDPYMTDRRVATVRYEQLRPFHPGRLTRALDRIEAGRCGHVVRSAGICRLATRMETAASWEHVGSAMWIDPLDLDDDSSAVGQDIVFTGVALMPHLLLRELDEAVLTDAELAAGPRAWRRFADPLPAWPDAASPADAIE